MSFVTFPSNVVEMIKGRRPRGVLTCKFFPSSLGKNKRVARVRMRERSLFWCKEREVVRLMMNGG